MEEKQAPWCVVVKPWDPAGEPVGGSQSGDDAVDARLRAGVAVPGSQAFPGVRPRSLVVPFGFLHELVTTVL